MNTEAPTAPPRLGEVIQLGFFVTDLDEALRFWVDAMGVRPFVRILNRVISIEYDGAPRELHQDHGFGYLGEVQIELIHQKNLVPSPYTDFLAGGGHGLNHLGFWSPAPQAAAAALEGEGLASLVDITIGDQLIRFFDAPSMGTAVEIIPHARIAFRDALKAFIGAQSETGDPVHTFASVEEFMAAAAL
jgi:catechol 2,3-dioxygenase-like lactoylglutathione lyase family enzyme